MLKNRNIAILIAAIIIILATLFGVGSSLNSLARNVEEMFYDGVYMEAAGFTERSINNHLGVLEQAVLDTSSLFANHPELSSEAEALRYARRELVDAQSISEKYSAYQSIQRASSAFISKANTVELSEREKESLVQFQSTLTGTTGAIQRSEYNVRARGFMDEASMFARLLRPFVFVTAPQAFDA